jgi:hypothetical protein
MQELKLPVEYLILFMLKKQGLLQLCVNYKKLNNIIVKNRYLLLNITDLQNRLARVRIFTKLDL